MNLEELKALCENATPGPWEAIQDSKFDDSWWVYPEDGDPITGEMFRENPPGNARFIAAARTALPKLIAAVEKILELNTDSIVEDEQRPDEDSNDDFNGGFLAGMDTAFEMIHEIINNALEES